MLSECLRIATELTFFLLLFLIPQVARTLSRLESVANFTEFVKAFSVFGAEMVELAHVTGKSMDWGETAEVSLLFANAPSM